MQEAIDIPVEVTLNDPDGSEDFYFLVDEDSVPAGSVITGVSGPITPSGGFYNLTSADLDGETGVFTLTPPLHWSSANPIQGDIVLETTTIVFDVSNVGDIDIGIPFPLNITVDIEGVADTPPSQTVVVNGTEDVPYPLGEVLAPELDGILIDVSRGNSMKYFRHEPC